MSHLPARLTKVIRDLGNDVYVAGIATKAVLRPLTMSQLQVYVTSSVFASWERPVYGAVFEPSTAIEVADEFEGPDFTGEVRKVTMVRVRGDLVAKHVIISTTPPSSGGGGAGGGGGTTGGS